MIELKNISKVYDNNEKIIVLNNMNITIKKNELVAIVGPSGSGKSTLLNIIGLMDDYTSGEYYLEGNLINIHNEDQNKLAKIRNEKFGFIYQNFALIDNLTIKENLELPIKYGNKHEKIKTKKEVLNEKAINVLKKFKLESKINKYPYELSGGEQQRIAIARAIINDAETILADEPTGALDKKTSDLVVEELLKLNKEGKTIVIVTHDLNVAKRCERIIEL